MSSLEETIADDIHRRVGSGLHHSAVDSCPCAFEAISIAAAVREWCLAPQQGERAAQALWEQQNPVEAMDDDAWDKLHRGDQTVAWHDARAVLHAVMGDTPDDSKGSDGLGEV